MSDEPELTSTDGVHWMPAGTPNYPKGKGILKKVADAVKKKVKPSAVDLVQLCIDAVAKIAPELKVTRTDAEPGNGFHSHHAAADFDCDDHSKILEAFRALQDTWPGGLGIGLPPAQIHLHVDARHRITNLGSGIPDTPAQWVEKGAWGPQYSETVRQNVTAQQWDLQLAEVAKVYEPPKTAV